MSPMIPYRPVQKSTARRTGAIALAALVAAAITGVGAYSWHAQRVGRSAPVSTARSAPVENDEHARVENAPTLEPPPRAAAPPRTASSPLAEGAGSVAESTGAVAESTGAGVGDRRAANVALKKALDSRIQRLELELAAASSAGATAEANRLRVFIRRLKSQVTLVSAEAEGERSAPQTGAL
jgi:hypothetical protein